MFTRSRLSRLRRSAGTNRRGSFRSVPLRADVNSSVDNFLDSCGATLVQQGMNPYEAVWTTATEMSLDDLVSILDELGVGPADLVSYYDGENRLDIAIQSAVVDTFVPLLEERANLFDVEPA